MPYGEELFLLETFFVAKKDCTCHNNYNGRMWEGFLIRGRDYIAIMQINAS